jgi:predicted permease
VEVGLALVLLVGAGLSLRGFTYLSNRDVGIETDRAAFMAMQLPANKYQDVVAQRAFWTELLERAAAVPGVSVAGAAHIIPLCSCNETNQFSIVGAPPFPQGEEPDVGIRIVSHRYFDALGIAILKGRALAGTDVANAPRTVVVNEAFEKQFFPEGAIGKQLRILDTVATEIVGVAENVRHGGPATEPKAEFFVPYTQATAREMTLIARADGVDPTSLISPLRDLVSSLDPELPLYDVRTARDLAYVSVGPVRLAAWLLSVMATMALVLSAVGINGVVAQLVSERRREIGIRMALGGDQRSVVLMVMRRGLNAVAVGLGAGFVVALMVGFAARSQLVGIKAIDPVTFVAVPVILAAAAILATWLPARRAARVNPVVALRAD